jgi:hypothetical protein
MSLNKNINNLSTRCVSLLLSGFTPSYNQAAPYSHVFITQQIEHYVRIENSRNSRKTAH